MIIPVILAGGTGTRLWPLSRELHPKQLLRLTGDHTMLQHTILRVRNVPDMADPVVICNENQAVMAAQQLRDMRVRPSAIFMEPVGRNTAPAVGIAALYALSVDPASRILILPADHLIRRMDAFHKVLLTAAAYADDKRLVTFGIVPDRPETGYGYIRKGKPARPVGGSGPGPAHPVFVIDQFVEKPDRETAAAYVASGDYCWNSGMFMFKAQQIYEELARFAPDIAAACRSAVDFGVRDGEFFHLDPVAFRKSPSDSIDYAVMEKTDQGVVAPLDAGWDDLGSWEAIWNLEKKDADGNVIRGDVVFFDASNSFVHAESRLVTLSGVRDLVVVETADAVMITGLKKTQGVKRIVDTLKNGNRPETTRHQLQATAWGTIETVEEEQNYRIRRITVNPGAVVSGAGPDVMSLQWICLAGTAALRIDVESITFRPSAPVVMDSGQIFQLKNSCDAPIVFLEICTGPTEPGDYFIVPSA